MDATGTVVIWFCLGSVLNVRAYSVQFPEPPKPPELNFTYHKHNSLETYLRAVSEAYPNLASLTSIGKTVQGRHLWVLEITASSKSETGIPNVKVLGNIHGNEAGGREIILHFIQFLVVNYSSNETVQWFLNNTRIHLLPTMNPDGFAKARMVDCGNDDIGRKNNQEMDLNRSFPDHFRGNTRLLRAKETEAVMNWMKKTPFLLSASLHGGALVANYPYENTVEDITVSVTGEVPKPHLSPDDDVFVHLATVYSATHPTMHKGLPCTEDGIAFENGIVNGAAWYSITGGMQDYNYMWHGCFELTLEISCCKYPPESDLPKLWEDNKEALLNFLFQAHKGVQGLVFDRDTNKTISTANMHILGRNMTFNTSKNGEFWRILLPNSYQLQVSAPGYVSETFNFVVSPTDNSRPAMTWLNVSLVPLSSSRSTVSYKKMKMNSTTLVMDQTTAPMHQLTTSMVDTYTTPKEISTFNRTLKVNETVTTTAYVPPDVFGPEVSIIITNLMQQIPSNLGHSTFSVGMQSVLSFFVVLLIA